MNMDKQELEEKIESLKKSLESCSEVNTSSWSDDDRETYHRIVAETQKLLDSYVEELKKIQNRK